MVRVIYEQVEAIIILNQKVQNSSKFINIMSATMGSTVQDLHNQNKDMDYYASKLHQVHKWVEVSKVSYLSLTLIFCFSLES